MTPRNSLGKRAQAAPPFSHFSHAPHVFGDLSREGLFSLSLFPRTPRSCAVSAKSPRATVVVHVPTPVSLDGSHPTRHGAKAPGARRCNGSLTAQDHDTGRCHDVRIGIATIAYVSRGFVHACRMHGCMVQASDYADRYSGSAGVARVERKGNRPGRGRFLGADRPRVEHPWTHDKASLLRALACGSGTPATPGLTRCTTPGIDNVCRKWQAPRPYRSGRWTCKEGIEKRGRADAGHPGHPLALSSKRQSLPTPRGAEFQEKGSPIWVLRW